MNRLIYVETSIPSFYFEARPGAQMQARREWTREWWDLARWQDALFTSAVVITELRETPDPVKLQEMIELLAPLPRLPYTDEIDTIVEVYLSHKLMPADSGGDAHHLALASFHRCDGLVTWNCKHLANPNKADQIRLVNGSLGLHTPQLVTPLGNSGVHAMTRSPMNPHDDGLEWLRDVRRKLLEESGGNLRRLGERYRQVEAAEPGKVVDPRKLLADAVRKTVV